MVNETGGTCQRCATTQSEVRLAADVLERSLCPLNMHVVLDEVPMNPETVAKDISQSNRIFLNDRPLVDWLGGKIGMSSCESCRPELGSNVKCRTLTLDGQTYEAIPVTLIVRAGLLAAQESLTKQVAAKPCCAKPFGSEPCSKPCGVKPGSKRSG